MPVGVIVDALAVVIGGIVGAVAGKKLKKDFIDNRSLYSILPSPNLGFFVLSL